MWAEEKDGRAVPGFSSFPNSLGFTTCTESREAPGRYARAQVLRQLLRRNSQMHRAI